MPVRLRPASVLLCFLAAPACAAPVKPVRPVLAGDSTMASGTGHGNALVPVAGAAAERQHAPPDGWAAQAGGTRGGALASLAHVYTVRDRASLLAALQAAAPARIVRVAASIDMSEGRPYLDAADQARRAVARIPSHTTLIGVSADAGLVNGSLAVVEAEQVIVRNLALRNPCDVAPRWDPRDGAQGNWNALYDAIGVAASHHVWIDHNSFTDAPLTDAVLPIENGMPRQCHDGALDITRGSDFVSVTANRFAEHEKTILVGGSDGAGGDRGRLRVSFRGNLFEHLAERAPRVRYGQVHLLNNYYIGERARAVYPQHYSIGVGKEARILSEANLFEIAGATACRDVVRDPGASPGVFADQGSLLNGAPLSDCPHAGDAGWRPPYAYAMLPAQQAGSQVLADAGPRAPDPAAGGIVEARLQPAAGAPFVFKLRRDDAGNWQGASLRASADGRELQLELLETRAGATLRLKQVRRPAPPHGAPLVLRVAAMDGELSAWLDGEKVTAVRTALLPASAPADWDTGAHVLQDLRGGPPSPPPERIALRAAGKLVLQAGDPAERIGLDAGGPGVEAHVDDPAVLGVAVKDGALLLAPRRPGRTLLTVGADPWTQAALAVEVGAPFSAPAPARRAAVRLFPANGERGVPPDTPLRIIFARPPVLSGTGSVRIYRQADRALVAIVRPGEAMIVLGPPGRQRMLRGRHIEAGGRELRIRLPRLLDTDTEYEAVAEARLLQSPGFDGARWRFRTTPYRPVGDSVSVDDDGRADFRTVQGALDYAMAQPRARPVTINVRDGVYPELLYLNGKDHVTLRGAGRDATIVRAANSDARNPGAGPPGMAGGRALFLAQDSDLLEIRDLTLHNSARRSEGPSAQAEALFFDQDRGRLLVRNARFSSEQDTLRLTGYAWFYRSLIEGNVDFIWGNNRAALFEDSEIRSLGDSARPDGGGGGGYIVQARTVSDADPGFVFLESRLTSGPGPAGNVPAPAGTWLARSPGTAHTWDKVAFIGCTVGAHIAPAGWLRDPAPHPGDGWSGYGNTTEDGSPRRFDGLQLDAHAAARLSRRSAVFAGFGEGRGWNPQP